MANYNSSYTGAQVDNAVKQFTANTATDGQVLTADGNGGFAWETPSGAPEGTAIKSTGVTSTQKVLNANGSGGAAWTDATTVVVTGSATSTAGLVLTSNGSGSAGWGKIDPEASMDTTTGSEGDVLAIDSTGDAVWQTPSNNAVFSLSGTTLTITNS